ncbi:hypothetical protein CWE09_12880 [Aliidiomarina minuta]|uniref:YCII-related domain-containing protein n=1 Tax=Aliidiomarina minuta TaxID=880057 RepID=A0A432W3U4_9GAMM|nr:YciI-like protein [Aliidiomarina minuta]RUO24034.1 hypothetical protein CWE09_12880 [Aliidiomarina minuta]
MYYLLTYQVVADYLDRREQYRDEHLKLANDYVEQGFLLLAGAKGDPIDGAYLVFKADSAEVVEAFAAADPYVKNKLVTRWTVEPWHVVVGSCLENPVL